MIRSSFISRLLEPTERDVGQVLSQDFTAELTNPPPNSHPIAWTSYQKAAQALQKIAPQALPGKYRSLPLLRVSAGSSSAG
jgi:hypothetical protein